MRNILVEYLFTARMPRIPSKRYTHYLPWRQSRAQKPCDKDDGDDVNMRAEETKSTNAQPTRDGHSHQRSLGNLVRHLVLPLNVNYEKLVDDGAPFTIGVHALEWSLQACSTLEFGRHLSTCDHCRTYPSQVHSEWQIVQTVRGIFR